MRVSLNPDEGNRTEKSQSDLNDIVIVIIQSNWQATQAMQASLDSMNRVMGFETRGPFQCLSQIDSNFETLGSAVSREHKIKRKRIS